MKMTHIVQIAIAGLMISLTTGCSSLGKQIADSMMHGKIVAMQEALNQAAADCGNAKSLARASNWALIGRDDIQQSMSYMTPESAEFLRANSLIGTLGSVISAGRHSQERHCTAATDTNHYVIAMTQPEIVVASR